MEKKTLLFIMLFCLSVAAIIAVAIPDNDKQVVVYNYTSSVDLKSITSKLDKIDSKKTVVEYCEKPVFAAIIKQPSRAGSYKKGVYDCSDMALSLTVSLNEIGYKRATYKVVDLDCSINETFDCSKFNTTKHAIVVIDEPTYYEATSGRQILPEEYKEYGII